MRAIDDSVSEAATSRIDGLIQGAIGVGKEYLARTIHRISPQNARPFLVVDCAAPTESIRSTLLGHNRQSSARDGDLSFDILDNANGGDVFLAEVGDLDPMVQADLMRLIGDRDAARLGGSAARRFEVRLIASTSWDLQSHARAGKFRLDLFFKLSRFILRIPPLRERVSEIPGLARQFVDGTCQRNGRRAPALSASVVDLLQRDPWPGNVAELKVVMELAVLACEGVEILPTHLGAAWVYPSTRPTTASLSQHQQILAALARNAECGMRRAAEVLGSSRRKSRR